MSCTSHISFFVQAYRANSSILKGYNRSYKPKISITSVVFTKRDLNAWGPKEVEEQSKMADDITHYADKDEHWVNVQAPIRHMFVALTKAMKDQQAEIHGLREKLNHTVTVEHVKDAVRMHAFTRTQGAEVETNKADKAYVKALEIKVEDANKQIARLTQIIQHQTTAITDLNYRVEKANESLDDYRKHINAPNFDPVFEYIDKQVKNVHEEVVSKVNSKLEIFAEQNEIKRNDKIEEVTSALHKEMSEQRVLLAAKADRELLPKIYSEIESNRQQIEINVAMIESNSAKLVNKELGIANANVDGKIQALAKELREQDALMNARHSDHERKLDQRVKELEDNSHVKIVKMEKMVTDTSLMEKVVVDCVKRHHWQGDVMEDEMRKRIADGVAATLRETRVACDSMKNALEQRQEAKLGQWYKLFEDKHERIRGLYDELQAGSVEAQKRMEELSEGLIKSLNKKANQSDLRALIKGGGGGMAASQIKEAISEMRRGGDTASDDSASTEYAQVAAAVLALGQGTGAKGDMETKISRNEESVDRLKSSLDTLRVELQQVKNDTAAKPSHADIDIAMMRFSPDGAAITDKDGKSLVVGKSQTTLKREAAWRTAVGELGSELRQELARRMTKDETALLVRAETSHFSAAIEKAAKLVEEKADHNKLSKLEQNLAILHSRVVSELTGGLWLWTSRQLTTDNMVPWDSQVVNAAPSSLLWREGSTGIMVKLPGLYKIGLSVFTALPVALTVMLNDEPLLSLEPDTGMNGRLSSYANAQGLREERYYLKRLRHSAGDVTAVTMEEPLSLPANATISVRYQSAAASQAFLSMRKL